MGGRGEEIGVKTEERLREPSFLRELGVVLVMLAKVAAVMLVLVGVLTPLFLWHPLAAVYAGCAIYLGSMIVYMARQNYKWRKQDFEYAREREQKDRAWREEWEKADAKRREGKSA